MTAPNTPAETSDQLNKPAKSGKLEVSDLITIGVFAALYFVMVCIATLVSTLFTSGFGSIFLPAITALISGCVYMLLAARLGKFGGITVMGVIIGLFLFISGHFVLSFIASIVFPVAADLIARGKDAAYIDGVFANINTGTFFISMIAILVCAVLGGWFGQRMMKKHFIKAGIA